MKCPQHLDSSTMEPCCCSRCSMQFRPSLKRHCLDRSICCSKTWICISAVMGLFQMCSTIPLLFSPEGVMSIVFRKTWYIFSVQIFYVLYVLLSLIIIHDILFLFTFYIASHLFWCCVYIYPFFMRGVINDTVHFNVKNNLLKCPFCLT